MANYHLSVQVISRIEGRSVVAASAYRRGERLHDERHGMVHDYSHKKGVIHSSFDIPEGSPLWIRDMVNDSGNVGQAFWNYVEVFEKNNKAQLAREVEFSLPVELTKEQNIALAREYIKDQFISRGMVADWSVHWDNEQNPHVHCLLTTRPLDEKGFGSRKQAVIDPETGLPKRKFQEGKGRDVIVYQRGDLWGSVEQMQEWRAKWAEYQNFHLKQHGHDVQVDHRSYKDQGIALEPTRKIGMAGMWMQRLGLVSDRYDKNRDIIVKVQKYIDKNPDILIEKISKQKSVFTEKDIEKEVARYFDKGGEPYTKVFGQVLKDEALIHLGERKGKQHYAMHGTVEVEHKMVEVAGKMADDSNGFFVAPTTVEQAIEKLNNELPSATEGKASLSDEQKQGAHYLLEEGRLKVLVGYAGTGKSTLLKVVASAYEQEGYRVRGAALSGIAASNLEECGIKAQTLASLEAKLSTAEQIMSENIGKPLSEKQRDYIQSTLLTDRDVLVIDEAGMNGSAQMQRVLEKADRAGAKVILVGDEEQLQSIEAGASFRNIREAVGSISLEGVRRQREEWQKEATVQFAQQKTFAALSAYGQRGYIHVVETDAKQKLVSDYMQSYMEAPEKSRLVLAFTRKDVAGLNSAIQQNMVEVGAVSRDRKAMEVTGIDNDGEFKFTEQFAKGDRIMFRENNKEMGVMNGTLATVKQLDGKQFTVSLDNGKELGFNLKEYSKIQLGYATTVHKSQGVTVDESYILASKHFDKHTTYVAMSRHREKAGLYADKENFSSTMALKASLSRATPKLTTLDFALQREIVPSQGLRDKVKQVVQQVQAGIEDVYEKVRSLVQDKPVGKREVQEKVQEAAAERTQKLREKMLIAAQAAMERAKKSGQQKDMVQGITRAATLTARAVNLVVPGQDKESPVQKQQVAELERPIRAVQKSIYDMASAYPEIVKDKQVPKSADIVDNQVLATVYAQRTEPEKAKTQEQDKGADFEY